MRHKILLQVCLNHTPTAFISSAFTVVSGLLYVHSCNLGGEQFSNDCYEQRMVSLFFHSAVIHVLVSTGGSTVWEVLGVGKVREGHVARARVTSAS